MKCFRCFSFVLFALLGVFFGSFIINQNNTYAVSVSCNIDLSSYMYDFSDCISTLDSSKDYYYTFKFKRGSTSNDDIHFTDGTTNALQRFSQSIDFGRFSALGPSFSDTLINTSVFTDSFSSTGHHFNRIVDYQGSLSYALSEVSLIVSDDSLVNSSPPSGSLEITGNGTYDVSNYAEAVVNVPETDCPPSSDGDYHNDLVAINNSIMICAATCLVIYFFYCIYRMIIKNSGVK